MPLSLVVWLLLIGLLSLFFTKWQRTGRVFVLLGFLILVLFSFSPFPSLLVHRLEQPFRPLRGFPYRANTIVVLGAGVRAETRSPPNTQLSSTSLARLIEGVRVYRLCKSVQARCYLMLSGGRVFGGLHTEAGVMQNTAVLLGVHHDDIRAENGSLNTEAEAAYLKRRLGHVPFVLVTSATHMQRALLIFRAHGMHPIAAPTQYLFRARSGRALWGWLPSARYLLLANIAIHEYLGIGWQQLNSWVKTLY